jgi:glucokinase
MAQTNSMISARDAQPPFFVGVDLGGTNVKVGVVDDLGRPIARFSIPTEDEKGPEDATRRMGQAVKDVIAKAGLKPADVARVGLGSPGTMDIPAGRLIRPVNLKGWDGFPIRDRLSHHCGLPTSFENDANAAAYGEFWVGSGRAFHSMVLLTLGTGIGCGIIIGDLLVSGENSHGAECGHIIIDCTEDARVCGCGQPGHLEAYASATAVIKRTEEALRAGRASSLGRRIASYDELTPLLVAEEAERGDEFSLEIIMETARYLGIGIVTLMHTIDPNGVLLGGAMTFGGKETELGRAFLARIKQEIDRRAFALLAERITLDFASLGGDAGFIGAAGVARLDHQKTTVRRPGNSA